MPGGGDAGLYDPERMLEIQLTLPVDDWAMMRREQRSILDLLCGDCLAQPFPSPYGWYQADIAVDGESAPRVGVRKKGLLGSVVSDRPSLKIDIDRFVEHQRLNGVEHLTLNNQHQDSSRIVACLAFGLFAKAGLPAPRCTLAHVLVNGEDLGVYANVEPLKKPLLKRLFGTGKGILYEGTLSDFRDGWTGTFEADTPAAEQDRGRSLRRVVAALERGRRDPGVLLDVLDEVLDLDEFFSFWAMETLVGEVDGYCANANNFYIHSAGHGPDVGRLRFVPWGIDMAFSGERPFGGGQPSSVVARSALPAALYADPAGRARYLAALRQHLDEVWNEQALIGDVDRLAELVHGRGDQARISEIRRWISGRRAVIEEELSDGAPDFDGKLLEPPCLRKIGRVRLAFDTSWGSWGAQDPFSYGDGVWALVLDESPVPVTHLGAVAGHDSDGALLLISGQLPNGARVAVYAVLDPELIPSQPADMAIDWREVTAALLYDEGGDVPDFRMKAYLGDGRLTLEEEVDANTSALHGRLSAVVWAS